MYVGGGEGRGEQGLRIFALLKEQEENDNIRLVSRLFDNFHLENLEISVFESFKKSFKAFFQLS